MTGARSAAELSTPVAELQGRVAVVTGGGSGIGFSIAAMLAQKGGKIVVAARQIPRLRDAAAMLSREYGGQILAVPVDTRDQRQVDALVDEVIKSFGGIDIWVNCAANPSGVANQIEHLDGDELLEDLNTKVVGYARCVKSVVPIMKARGGGRIVNIGGFTGRSSDTLSGMRNAALCHMTKVLSDQLGPFGITVNIVHPGIVRTPHLVELFEEKAQLQGISVAEVEADFVKDTPMRRILQPEEVASMVGFLTSSQAASITGQSFAVDGGFSRGIYL